jgi:hypothetical protein
MTIFIFHQQKLIHSPPDCILMYKYKLKPIFLETIYWVNILQFFDADPVSEMEKIRIRDGKNSDLRSGDKHPGSATPLTAAHLVPCRALWRAPATALLQLRQCGLNGGKLGNVRQGDGEASLQPRRDHRTLGQRGVARCHQSRRR